LNTWFCMFYWNFEDFQHLFIKLGIKLLGYPNIGIIFMSIKSNFCMYCLWVVQDVFSVGFEIQDYADHLLGFSEDCSLFLKFVLCPLKGSICPLFWLCPVFPKFCRFTLDKMDSSVEAKKTNVDTKIVLKKCELG